MAHARATERGFAIAAAAPWTGFGFCVAMLLLMAFLVGLTHRRSFGSSLDLRLNKLVDTGGGAALI